MFRSWVTTATRDELRVEAARAITRAQETSRGRTSRQKRECTMMHLMTANALATLAITAPEGTER